MSQHRNHQWLSCVLAISAICAAAPEAHAQSPYPFVDSEFVVPSELETDDFRLRTLTVNDVVKDFEAVMATADQIKSIWPDSEWPEGLTLEQNLIDLGWHQKEFQIRRSFTYTVVTLDETKVIGCVYIYPSRKRGYDAVVYLWARESVLGSPPDELLYDTVSQWMATEWPFENVAFPGRNIDWESWDEIEDEER